MPRAVPGCAKGLGNIQRRVSSWESRQLCTTQNQPSCLGSHAGMCWPKSLHKWIRGDLQLEGFKRSLHIVNIHLKIAPHVAPAHAVEHLTASCKTGQRLFPGSPTKLSPSAFNLLI